MRALNNFGLFVACAAFLLGCLAPLASAYRFLGVLPMGARSHYIVGSSLLRELARKGHDVTVISPFPLKKPLKNFHDVPAPTIMKLMEKSKDDLLATIERSIVQNILNFHNHGLDYTRAVLGEPGVKALMASNQTFDAVIAEIFLDEAILGIAEHFKAPLIAFGAFGAHAWNTDLVGSPSPPSYVPSAMLHFTDHMTLPQRLGNFAFNVFERLLLDLYYLPKQEEIYKRYFPNNKQDMYETRRNTALVLLNQHVSLSFPRPYVPNQIEVGGMHINRQRTPLPADLEKFISESPHGVIYFSMGSNLKSKSLPLEKRRIILETFRGLKQRVLWKFEDANLEGKPDNVYISSWFPQDDILAHENVVGFITHGGLLSTTESIYHGKPFIGIPIFGDQFLNMGRAESGGYGIMLDYLKLTKESFKGAIDKLLSTPSYMQRVKDMSARYRDQPMNPLDLAVYWVEYVTRHKGARHLHCAGQDLGFVEYHNIDVMLIFFGGLALLLLVVMIVIRFIWGLLQKLCARKPNQSKLKKN